MKKILALVACLSLVASLAIGGSIAYLTDRDSEANVFTIGDVAIDLTESFGQGATLIPGVNIQKKPVITNTGKNDAWVWMEFAIPAALDNLVQGSEQGSNENIIHWNPIAAVTDGFSTEAKYDAAMAAGRLPAGTTWEEIQAGKTWNVFDSIADGENVYQKEINDVMYNVYVMLYNKALTPDETSLPCFDNVFLDAQIDIDPNGDWYRVVNGTATKIEWNTNTNGSPIIYVSAYGIQKEGFADVKAAYAAYGKQWGTNGSEYATPTEIQTVTTADELKAAIANAKDNELVALKIPAGTTITADKVDITGKKNVSISGEGTFDGQFHVTGNLTLTGINVTNKNATSSGISKAANNAIYVQGEGVVTCEKVTFTNEVSGKTILTTWWSSASTNPNAKWNNVILKNCVFNCNGERALQIEGNATIEGCTFNDPYRYAAQLTCGNANSEKVVINFHNNKIVNGLNGKEFVYGLQLTCDYGNRNMIINGSGNTIVDGGSDSYLYVYEDGTGIDNGKVDLETIELNVTDGTLTLVD